MAYLIKKHNELNDKYNQLKIMTNIINNTPMPANGMDEMDLDDLLSYREQINDNIKELEMILYVIKRTKEYKEELFEKSINILYHPSRISRLLNNNLISFTDGSFDEL